MTILNNMADISDDSQITIKPEFRRYISFYTDLDYRKSNMSLADIANELKKYGYKFDILDRLDYVEDPTLYFSNKNHNYMSFAISNIFEDNLPEIFNWAIENRDLGGVQALLKYFELIMDFKNKYDSLPDDAKLQLEMIPVNDLEDAA